MAEQKKTKGRSSKTSKGPGAIGRIRAFCTRWIFRAVLAIMVLAILLTFLFSIVNPPTTPYMYAEGSRLGEVSHEWVDFEDIAPVMARSVVAAEDANFCLHWGLDVKAIREAIDEGGARGGSTISQQTVKNVFLWQGRSWLRKATEALWTPLSEAIWTKRRILELYLNMIEFGEGVFGVQAAAQHYFGVDASDLSARQAARLAVILPLPKERNATDLSNRLLRRAAQVADGAATIAADGRADCFSN